MKQFEVGKQYAWYERGYDGITVLSRTPKSIKVTNGGCTWRMYIRKDSDGNEYVVDSCVPKSWRDEFTCSAKWELA